jgi:hypothetical protein
MQVVPHLSAAWQHAFDDVTPGAALAFASTGIGFGIEGVPLAEDSALIDAGFDVALGPNTPPVCPIPASSATASPTTASRAASPGCSEFLRLSCPRTRASNNR